MARCKTTCGRRLNQKLTLQQESGALDAAGQDIPTWAKVADVWGEVLSPGGGETPRGLQVHANTTSVVTIRHRTDVTPQMRLVLGTRNLGIISAVDPDGRREWLVCQCLEDAG